MLRKKYELFAAEFPWLDKLLSFEDINPYVIDTISVERIDEDVLSRTPMEFKFKFTGREGSKKDIYNIITKVEGPTPVNKDGEERKYDFACAAREIYKDYEEHGQCKQVLEQKGYMILESIWDFYFKPENIVAIVLVHTEKEEVYGKFSYKVNVVIYLQPKDSDLISRMLMEHEDRTKLEIKHEIDVATLFGPKSEAH